MNYINCILQDNFSNTQDLPGNIQDVDEVEGIIFCQKCHKYIESDWTAIPMSDGTMFFLCINCHKFSISNVDGEWTEEWGVEHYATLTASSPAPLALLALELTRYDVDEDGVFSERGLLTHPKGFM